MSIDLKFVELTADVLKIFLIKYDTHKHKLFRSTRSGLTAVVLCNWSMYNFSNHTQRTWSVTLLAPDA